MLTFPRIDTKHDPLCEKCRLMPIAVKHPGLPTIPFCRVALDQPVTTAVLVVGKAPTFADDKEGGQWSGPVATLLQELLIGGGHCKYADFFLTNAIRCYVNADSSIPRSAVTCCRKHLLNDIRELQSKYHKVILMALGSEATNAISAHRSISAALNFQGHDFDLAGLLTTPVQCFFTYHPRQLMPDMTPQLIDVVGAHLDLLLKAVQGTYLPPQPIPPPCHLPPHSLIDQDDIRLLSLDIETYGILKGYNQTVFSPVRSRFVDGVPQGKQVVCVSLAWLDKKGEERTGILFPQKPDHLTELAHWLYRLARKGGTVIGKNIPFDLAYLRYNHPLLRQVTDPTSPLKFDDVGIWNFLDYELRPEVGLKPLSRLFNLVEYEELTVSCLHGEVKQAESADDPALWKYATLDAVANLRVLAQLKENISGTFGPSSPKFSETCATHRHHLIHIVLGMAEAGIHMDRTGLEKLGGRYTKLLAYLGKRIKRNYGFPLSGPGSGKAADKMCLEIATHLCLLGDPRLLLTDKHKKVSTKAENIELFLTRLIETDTVNNKYRYYLQHLSLHRSLTKLNSSYINPLIKSEHKGLLKANNIAYPQWFTTAHARTDEASEDGGTIQGRLSAKNPPAQTQPPSIAAYTTSRFEGGSIIKGDEATLELRVAALLSGDTPFIRVFERGGDPHGVTATDIFPNISPDHPLWRELYRQAGKTLNFLTLFLGQAAKFQQTLVADTGTLLPLEECKRFITTFDNNHPELRSWQADLIHFVRVHGYLELPTGWSRTYPYECSAYQNEIVNQPVQTIAAQLVQSAQFAIYQEIVKMKLRSLIINQRHDDVQIDTHPTETIIVRELLTKHLERPPLLTFIESNCNRTVPLIAEIKEIRNA